MQDQPSTSDDSASDDRQAPPRPKTVPDDYIWDPEEYAWYPPGEPTNWDGEAFSRELQETIRQFREKCIAEGTWNNGTVIHLGPLPKVPQWMRKTLRNKPEKRLPLFDDDDTPATKQEPTPCDSDGDEPSDELS